MNDKNTPYTLPSEGFVKLPNVLMCIPVSRSTWYAGVSLDIYPQPVRISAKSVAWNVADIRTLMKKIEENKLH